ncbi:MAG: hypothetical protein JWP37_4267 [Mucilaginibacter sp.]|nr:hypothetical protein [Mucilaginibacter sp.]
MIAALFSCKNSYKKLELSNQDTTINSVSKQSEPDIISGNDKDSVNISADTDDTFKYSKGDLRKIIKACPEFTKELHYAPDVSLAKLKGVTINIGGKDNTMNFNCEVCQDNYYVLYAFFLKMGDCDEQYKMQRQTLIKLYRDLNFIFGRLRHGGTYYGHQYSRILGYAEYSVYLLHEDGNYGDFKKSYSISKQKALYIAALKQTIEDEVSSDNETLSKQKPNNKKELLKTVNEMDSLITDYFYLNMVQEFQYSHY